ncbi:MAG TPA: YdeI/OmpD-associated family protein [Chthoniobacterales bacterium]|jgi:uncharacterized protein YdeI (YjbR/CyaY-like superfamily)
MINERPIFLERPSQFREWLKKNHTTCPQQWIGFHRKSSGRPSITWPEAVDEALCFGWIDGLRKTVNEKSYKIRFTPRRRQSTWSAINIARMKELRRLGRIHPAGSKAFARRLPAKSGIYSYENRQNAVLDMSGNRKFRSNNAAWAWFQEQTPAYRRTVIWWIVSAKRPETREKRLAILIADSAAKRRIALLRANKTR